MRKRFLVLSSLAAISLASLAGAASADTQITASLKCSGAAGTYTRIQTFTVEQLPANFHPYSYSYSFPVPGGIETCTVSVA